MDIIIDTNIIVPEYSLDGSRTRVLFRSLASTSYQLYVPKIVIDEVCGLIFRQSMDLKRRFGKKVEEVKSRRLPIDLSPFYSVPSDGVISGQIAAYRSALVTKMEAAGARFLEYPTVSHEEVVQRLIQQRLPFLYEKDDEGYRDALVWESVLEHARNTTESIAFLSLDRTAFAGPDGLHDDLIRDMQLQAIEPGRITLFSEFQDFVASHLAVHIELEDVRERLSHLLTSGDMLDRYVRAELPLQLNGFELGTIPISARVTSASITSISEISETLLRNVVKLPSDEYLAQLTTSLAAIVDYDAIDPSLSPMTEQTSHGQYDAALSVSYSAVLDADLKAATSLTIESVNVTSGRYRQSPEQERQSAMQAELFRLRYQRLRDQISEAFTSTGAAILWDERNQIGFSGIFHERTVLVARRGSHRVAAIPYVAFSPDDVPRLYGTAQSLSGFMRDANITEGFVVTDSQQVSEAVTEGVRIIRLFDLPSRIADVYRDDDAPDGPTSDTTPHQQL